MGCASGQSFLHTPPHDGKDCHARDPDVAHLEANYVLELDGGHRILVENRAVRTGDPEGLRAMMAGKAVDPARIYFRCVPELSADEAGPYAWMNRTLFVGTGQRRPTGVRIDVFRVR